MGIPISLKKKYFFFNKPSVIRGKNQPVPSPLPWRGGGVVTSEARSAKRVETSPEQSEGEAS